MGVDSRALSRIANSGEAAKSSLQGIAGDNLIEPVPNFIEAPSEKVLANSNNAWIVMGRDRPGPRTSGYGGKGDTQAASIDIVVGRMANSAKSVDGKGEKVFVDPDFKIDAARIHISQKTDIDENFGLVAGRVGAANTKSGIALKADGVRVIARDGIKLVTRTDRRNSQGGEIQSIAGIDLIAGNDDTELQPMVKGDNLVAAFEQLVSHVDALNGIVDSFLMSQMELNAFITTHFHVSPFLGIPNVPSPVVVPAGISTATRQLVQTKASLLANKANLVTYKMNYFNPAGDRYINSRYNHTN